MRLTFLFAIAWAGCVVAEPAKHPSYFGIHVVDDATGRGVPLVELKTTSSVKFYTDSAGWVAIDDPAMLGHKVFFSVASYGYQFAADGFGFRGTAIDLTAGGEAELKVHRLNVAERLYRLTGEGIYRDSALLGKPMPIAQPQLNGEVCGQDSTMVAIYRGKLWWLWGDTARQSYPLGQFSMSGATSELPGQGDGLDPSVGVNYHYFTDARGFSRPMVPPNGAELHWIDGMVVVKDAATGQERLVGVNTKLKDLGHPLAREFVVLNDDTDTFEAKGNLDLDSPVRLNGHPFHHAVDGVDYVYCGDPFPNLRVKADYASVSDPAAFEAYAPGERDADGKVTWSWRRGAQPLSSAEQEAQIKSGKLKAGETPQRLRDASTGERVLAQGGSVCWNEYRKRWVMIAVQAYGKPSFLGEVWYAEAPNPEGPWRDAVKIVTHDRYSFYNPVQHPFFDADGGRTVYFEGTYASTFSRDGGEVTPRYEYNQMMYRLDLGDERLKGARGK